MLKRVNLNRLTKRGTQNLEAVPWLKKVAVEAVAWRLVSGAENRKCLQESACAFLERF